MKIESMKQIDSGYRSSVQDWQSFLTCWEDRMLQDRSKETTPLKTPLIRLARIETDEYARNVRALDATERRLNMKLPASYRHFAALTGGYWLVDSEGDQHLSTEAPASHFLPVPEIGLFKDIDRVNWPIWDNNRVSRRASADLYYRYDTFERSTQDPSVFRDEQLDHLIKLGEFRGGAVVLLNPTEVTADGEYEAWFLAPYIAGAVRTRSFAELMQFLATRELDDGKTIVTAFMKRNSCAGKLMTAAGSK